MRYRRMIMMGAVALATLLTVATAASAEESARKIRISTTEFKFQPSTIMVKAGEKVALTLLNEGKKKTEHELMVEVEAGGTATVAAQQPRMPEHPGMMPPGEAAPSEPKHGDHSTPAGWRLTWPQGAPARGREVFVKMECYSCHEVKGEKFPAPTEPGKVGPELSAMGPLHEVEYFVEAVVNPSATIDKGKGYEAPDGSSKMPSFNDAMTVQELVDLVAFLKSLQPPTSSMGGGHRGHQ